MSSQATLSIGGMTCTNCSNAIEKLLTPLKGIHKVSISLVLNSCIITFNEDTISIDIIIDEIEDIGFEVSLVSIRKSSLLQSSSDNIIQNMNKKSKYYVISNQINKKDIIIWSAQINTNDETDIKLDESYFYNIMNDTIGIIEISYNHNTNNLLITFNKTDILSMTISDLIQSYSDNQLIISDIQLKKKYIQYKSTEDIHTEIKTIAFDTNAFHKSFTTLCKKQLKQKFDKNITEIELDMDSGHLIIQYYNSTDSPHTARDIYKYLKNDMNFHDTICVDTSKNESNIYHIQQQKAVKKLRDSFYISCLFGIPAFIIALILPHFEGIHDNILMYPIIPGNNSVTFMGVLLFLLATPVQFWIGKQFYISAWNAAKQKTSNMSTLIALGTTMAWIYSFFALIIAFATVPQDPQQPLHQGAHFFETCTTVIMVILLGKWLQAKAKYKTCDAIGMLMEIQSPFAYLIEINEYGEIIKYNKNDNEEISTELIVVGDIIKVFGGGRIPLDGTIIYGATDIDESMITGESMPRHVSVGDMCISSSINCGQGMILIRVDKNKSNSVIAKVIELMKSSQMNKPKQQELADTISSYFVPVVILISLVTFLLWYGLCLMGCVPPEWYQGQNCLFFALLFAMAVMVIACPCALGLATPTAVMVGMGVATKYGCLIKGGNVLELAYNIDVLVFDKTGTLTYGKPQVINIKNFSSNDSISKDKLLFYIGSAELNSQHPLAKAIVSYTQKELRNISSKLHLLTPTSCQPIPGKGIKTIVDGHTVNIGNYDWFFNSTIINTLRLPENITRNDIENILFQQNNQGYITLLISIDNELVSYITLFDKPRPEAKKLITELQNKYKIKCVMLTGDNHNTAIAVAKQLGMNEANVISQVLPQDKHQIIKEIQFGKLTGITNDLKIVNSKDVKYVKLCMDDTADDEDSVKEDMIARNECMYKVGMVGDGINDAAALSQANFGIAIGDGTDIAIEAADMILMNDNLWNIATLLDLSKTIIHRIYINFLFSFGFNVLGIPIAAGILYPTLHLRLPPEIASICMAASSLCVLTSSILLKWYKSPYNVDGK